MSVSDTPTHAAIALRPRRRAAPMSKAGTIRLGDLRVDRLGFGAMQLPGPGVWGPPATPPDGPVGAIALLRRVVELGVNFIDTADATSRRK